MATNNAINAPKPFSSEIGGTGLASPVANEILYTNGSSPYGTIPMTDGDVIIGRTGNTPVANKFTAGTGISIVYGAGSITFSSTGAETWVDQTTPTVTLANNTGYIANAGVSLITFTLPATANVGDWIEINGLASGLFTIAQNAGQSIIFGDTTSTVGVGGSVTSTLPSDGLKIRCVVADLTWTLVSAVGDLDVI